MSEEKQDVQVEPTVSTEQVEPADATPQPSIEALTQENARKEVEIKRLQGISKDLQKRGVPREEFNALQKLVEDSNAGMMDYLEKHLGEGEVEAPIKKTHRQRLDEKRAQVKPEPPDPAADEFMTYIGKQGFAHNHPLVLEAVAGDRTPEDALTYIKGKVDEKSQTTVEKQIAVGVRIGVENELKAQGLTVSGPESPSAPTTGWHGKSPEEKVLIGVTPKK